MKTQSPGLRIYFKANGMTIQSLLPQYNNNEVARHFRRAFSYETITTYSNKAVLLFSSNVG